MAAIFATCRFYRQIVPHFYETVEKIVQEKSTSSNF